MFDSHFRTGGATIKRRVVLFALAMCGAQTVVAQSTIFNIPSTDTVAPKKAYVEFDYLLQMPGPSGGGPRLQIAVPRFVVGIAPNVEAGANFAFYHQTATNSFFQPNIKWKFAHSDDMGLAGSAGLIWYTPMNNRTGVDSYGLIYGNGSKKMKGAYGPRFTVGPYGIVGAESNYVGTKGGVIAGYEQPVHAKASIVADWISGVSGFGYFTPGISVTLPHSGLFNVGYSLGNDSYNGNNNRFLFVYYGITFP